MVACSTISAGWLQDAPLVDTVARLCEGTTLLVGMQVGLSRKDIIALTTSDLHQNCGFDVLPVIRNGGWSYALASNSQAVQRFPAYLKRTEREDDNQEPLSQLLRGDVKAHNLVGWLVGLTQTCSTKCYRKTPSGSGWSGATSRTRCRRQTLSRRRRTACNSKICRKWLSTST